MIGVKNDGDRIKIHFPYNPSYITKIKTVEEYGRYPTDNYNTSSAIRNLKISIKVI